MKGKHDLQIREIIKVLTATLGRSEEFQEDVLFSLDLFFDPNTKFISYEEAMKIYEAKHLDLNRTMEDSKARGA